MTRPRTYTAQYAGKWHTGFTIGNQSFTLSAHEGTEEEAEWYAEMLDKALGKLAEAEECGYVPADTWCSVCICKGCGEACSEAGEKEPYPYCPYCRRKIKR